MATQIKTFDNCGIPWIDEHLPEPWITCGASNDNCSCGMIWSEPADCTVATVEQGEWGDEVPTIQIVGDNVLGSCSGEVTLKAVMTMIAYGEIPAGVGQANARRIVACINACWGVPNEQLEPKMLARLMEAE